MSVTVVDRKTATKNIIATLRSADADDWAYGANWYIRAHQEAVRLSDTYGLEVEQTAGIIAVLSPRLEWTLNLRKAEEVCATGTTTGLSLSVGKAERIYNGEPVREVIAPPARSPRSGQKVRAFFANIYDPLFSQAVTVDRHAYDVTQGVVGNDDERGALNRVGVYDEIAAAYRSAARALGLLPHQVQAVTWEAWRKQKTFDNSQRLAAGLAPLVEA